MPITRSKNGQRFTVYSQRRGERVYVGTFDSEREAVSAERRFLVTQEQIASGELPPEHDAKRTLSMAVKEWLKSLKANGSRSHGQYDERMNAYILPKLRDVPIVGMRKSHVMKWRDDMATEYAANTVNGSLTCLSSAFTYFVDQDWIPSNPVHGVAQLEIKDGSVYEWIRTREEITKLLGECPKGIRELVAVAVLTGMRLDELVHLRWADVDIERRLIAVHRGRHGTTKSGKARYIPILDALLPFLRSLALNRDGATLVFPGRKGKVRTKPGIRFPFKQAAARAGLSKKLRFHDLRHTFASHWVLEGGDIFRLSKILGHSSVTVTQNVYAHLAPEAWEQDYHRLAFTLPSEGTVYALTKRKPANDAAAAATSPDRALRAV
jgi:integrase